MKVLIVGGRSSVGKALKLHLESDGHILTAGRSNCDISLDLNDPLDKFDLPGDIDVVIHTAASFGGSSGDEMRSALDTNVLGTLKLLQASANAGIRHFILISSMSIYLESDSPYYSSYSITKRFAEELAWFFSCANNIPLTILRPSQIYGESDDFKLHQPFFYSIIDNVFKGINVQIYGSRDPQRNYLHISDLSIVISKVIRSRLTGRFDCTHPENLTYAQIAQSAKEVFDSASEIQFLHNMKDIPDNVFPLNTELYQALNYFPQISIANGIRKLAKYRHG